MNTKTLLLLTLLAVAATGFAQDDEEPIKKPFADNVFTGGSVSLSFGSNSFLVGGNPVLGYKLAEWVDAGFIVNYQYTSWRHYQVVNDKLRQNIYGGGVFARLYPVNFLFGQAQFEHNFITLKYIPPNGASPDNIKTSANSFLVGAGYAQGRMPGVNNAFFYFSILWDISDNDASPYTNAAGNAVPIFRAGVNIYPFVERRRF